MKKWICILIWTAACGVTGPDVSSGPSTQATDTSVETSSSQQGITADTPDDSFLTCGTHQEICAPDERCCHCTGPGGQRFAYCDVTCPVGPQCDGGG